MRGYKVFNSDWTCRGFDYKNGLETPVGQTFEHKGNIGICSKGFHFCKKASDCFDYYSFDKNNKVAEVESLDLLETEGNKSVTNKIQIIKELTWHEVLDLVNEGIDNTGLKNTGDANTGNRNTGDWNTGNRNTGNRNTGDWNTGDANTGDWNTGDANTGDWNTGNRNTGDWNTGNRNTGNRNTGNANTGNRNTGDWNTIEDSTGVFCSEKQNVKIFDKESDLTYLDWYNSAVAEILRWNLELNVWIYESSMSAEEKEKYPTFETTGGYLKNIEFKEACKNMWNNLTDNEKDKVFKITNFDKDKFEIITGINL